ncbi:Acyl dehydratase [Haladaptatus litoreus]|uniref:Acyl dehydratase n=1 Tax=Haladaptatus litoreus TaxID=553468 RepID=A0A1N6YQJ3_9EURY|nr:MaoC family dehydratase N-terminal domain-containing protein [Haladaptatus litoreus]SIR16826.1 Acyl dehydratase [Haladaptatus litoreus]
MAELPAEGETKSYSRTFTNEDVAQFADLSGDRGSHHEEGDNPMVHGLLTATLPTKIGGDMDYIAQSMSFEFHRPVYVGEEITCESTVESFESRETRHEMVASFVCRNEDGEVVLDGETEGVIFR